MFYNISMELLNLRNRADEAAYESDIWVFLYSIERQFKKDRTKKQIKDGFFVSMINPNFMHKRNVCFMILFKDRKDLSGKQFKSVVFECQKECFDEEVEVGFKKHLDFINTHKDFQEALVFADAVYGMQNKDELKNKIDDFNENKQKYVQKFYDELADIVDNLPNAPLDEKTK